MNSIGVNIKETLSPSAIWGHNGKMTIYESGSGHSPDKESANTLVLMSQPPEEWEKKLCYLSHPVYVIVVTAWMD